MYIQIDRSKKIPLNRQIYRSLKESILTDKLVPDAKLLSSRALSKELGVSRNVVLEAYEQLTAEGYIESSKGSGTYVKAGTALSSYNSSHSLKKEALIGLRHEPKENLIDFRTGVPCLSLFPKEKWGLIYRQVCQEIDPLNLDYHEPRGCYELRFQLSRYLNRVRGVQCPPHQLFITTGAAQAFTIMGQLFSSVRPLAIVEDPISEGIINSLKLTNMSIYPVPVDGDGLMTELLPDNIYPGLIFTIPSHQFPTGAILPIKRRIELIQYANNRDAYIVEDDYDSEFRFEGSPIQSLQSLDPSRVIYIGTFSKILCPALRMGYMILPESLVDKVMSIKYLLDLHSPVLEQLTLSRFIREGYLDKHVRQSKKYYSKKNAFLIELLKQAFGDKVRAIGHLAGIHLVASFNKVEFSQDFLCRLESNGLKITPMEAHTINKGLRTNQILIGYGNLSDTELVKGIQILKKTIMRNQDI